MAAPRVAFAGRTLPAYARTVGRAVHIKIHPRPGNLAESSEVLRVLQQYGEVVMYKHLKHEPGLHAENTALAIYQNIEAAQTIMDASPLRFELGRADSSTSASDYVPSSPSGAAQPTAEEAKGQTASMIEDTSSDPKVHWSSAQQSAPGDQEEFNEAVKPRKEKVSAEDGWAAFKGLQGTISQAPAPDTPQANSIPTTTLRPPKPFTANPTPSTSSPTDLPYTSSYSSSQASPTDEKEKDTREFHLTITRSTLNHQAYIQRQHYYGGWRLDEKTLMADDLQGRVPVDGFRDCQLGRGETPLRVRLRRREREDGGNEALEGGARRRKRLGELWEEGRIMREAGVEGWERELGVRDV